MTSIGTATKFRLVHLSKPIYMPGPEPHARIHMVARISTGLREFVLLQDLAQLERVWLNEMSATGALYPIDDDDLFHDLYAFLADKGLVSVYADQDKEASKQGGVH